MNTVKCEMKAHYTHNYIYYTEACQDWDGVLCCALCYRTRHQVLQYQYRLQFLG